LCWLLIEKTNTEKQAGLKKWDKTLEIDLGSWKPIFISFRTICKDVKLEELNFKISLRIVVTRKELFRFGIKAGGKCLYCGDLDSFDHTFIHCHLFNEKVIRV